MLSNYMYFVFSGYFIKLVMYDFSFDGLLKLLGIIISDDNHVICWIFFKPCWNLILVN